jgi:hypothetical protein
VNKEKWVIVNLDGEYLKCVTSSISEEYTTDANQALTFNTRIDAQKECDVFEHPKQIK